MEEYNYLTYFAKIDARMRNYIICAMRNYQALDKKGNKYQDTEKVYISLFLAGLNTNYGFSEMMNKAFCNKLNPANFYGIKGTLDDVSMINRHKYFQVFKSRLIYLSKLPNTLEVIRKENLFEELILYNLFCEELTHSNIIIKLFKDTFSDYIPTYNLIKTYLAGVVSEKINRLNIRYRIPEGASNTLSKYSEILTQKEYSRNPAIGREKELEEIKINLLLQEKSLLLVGEAGVGKTSIVYSLAKDIKEGNVPSFLKNLEIIKLNINALISGTKYRGEFENRVEEIIREVQNNQDIVLYIEEMHSMVGLGKTEDSGLDFVNTLKPYLANGNIRIIGDTTKEEYTKYIKTDNAFDRRFKVIEIKEPAKNDLFKILDYVLEELINKYQIEFNFTDAERNILWNELVNLTTNSYVTTKDGITNSKKNPDLVLDILKLAFAKAVYSEKTELTIEDIIYAINVNPDINDSRKEEKIRNIKNNLKRNTTLKLIKTNSIVK